MLIVLSIARSCGSDNKDAQTILSNIQGLDLLPVTVGLRKSFSNATSEGKGVIETKSDPKAIEEIKALHDAIFDVKMTVNSVINKSK